MASWQSQLIKFTMQNRHLLQGRLKRENWNESYSVQAFRELCENGAQKMKMPAGVESVPAAIEGLPEGLAAEWIQPTAGGSIKPVENAVIFYVHGGGYISGSCSDHRAFVAKFAAGTGIRSLLYEYRLAPEHTYPAAVDDTLTAYRWLLKQVAPETRIIIAGESAGGGLCLAALLAIRDLGLRLPDAGVAISPWTDLKLTGASYQTRLSASIEPYGMSKVCSQMYTGAHDPCHPWISPLYGDLHGLPPLLIDVGNDEIMRDDSAMFAEKARAAGIDVILNVAEGQVHCYPLLPEFIPESKQAMDEICRFILQHASPALEPAAG